MAVLELATILSLAAACGPTVHPHTTAAIIQVESGGDPLAIGNNTRKSGIHPHSREDAVRSADEFLHQGHRLDIGLMQINSRWLKVYDITPTDLLDPCFNIVIGTQILTDNYARYSTSSGDQATSLQRALSAYNTGSPTAGGSYVKRVYAAAGRPFTVKVTSPSLPDEGTEDVGFDALSFRHDSGNALFFPPE